MASFHAEILTEQYKVHDNQSFIVHQLSGYSIHVDYSGKVTGQSVKTQVNGFFFYIVIPINYYEGPISGGISIHD